MRGSKAAFIDSLLYIAYLYIIQFMVQSLELSHEYGQTTLFGLFVDNFSCDV